MQEGLLWALDRLRQSVHLNRRVYREQRRPESLGMLRTRRGRGPLARLGRGGPRLKAKLAGPGCSKAGQEEGAPN